MTSQQTLDCHEIASLTCAWNSELQLERRQTLYFISLRTRWSILLLLQRQSGQLEQDQARSKGPESWISLLATNQSEYGLAINFVDTSCYVGKIPRRSPADKEKPGSGRVSLPSVNKRLTSSQLTGKDMHWQFMMIRCMSIREPGVLQKLKPQMLSAF